MVQRVIRQVRTTAVNDTAPSDYIAKKTIFRTYQALFYILAVIETLLGFRFLLRIMAANQASGFTQFIYVLSAPLVEPFRGIVPSATVGGSVAEWFTLIAMAVYAVIIWLIIEFFQIVKPVDEVEVEETVDNV